MTPRYAIRNNWTLVGSWVNSGSTAIAELMSSAGFDFLCVDAEHSPVDFEKCADLFRAINAGSGSCHPFVRIPGVDYAQAKRYLDAGAKGIIAPLVNSRIQAEILVAACRYPPEGRRGVGFARSNDYGTYIDAIRQANDEILVAVQIEHADALTNLRDILTVPGVDACFIGPYDLSASLGVPGEFNAPIYRNALQDIANACEDADVARGIHVVEPDPEALEAAKNAGYQVIAYSLDITMLSHACARAL